MLVTARRSLLLPLLFAAGPLLAQDSIPSPATRPLQVTDSAVARGRELFHGSASCATCHGIAAVGTDSGPALSQGIWLHGPDSYEGILSRVLHGIPKAWTTRDVTMPMRGWSTLTDAQARDVAAYVWVVSHPWMVPARRAPS